jgi:hypothetical protein
MNFFEILKEGRKEDFLGKFSKKFSQEQLNRIVGSVLPKYLDWVGNKLDSIEFDQVFPNLINLLNKFEKISSNLPITDLYQYGSIKNLNDAIVSYENKPKRDISSFEGGNIVYDDGRFFIVNPLTHKASCYYGAGTKWCTAASTDYQFNTHNEDGKLFYVLDRNLPTSDPYYKIAISKKFDGNVSFWDAQDKSIQNPKNVWGEGVSKKIFDSIDQYFSLEFAEQLKIFSDKERAHLERERLERLRIERIDRERIEEAQERRDSNEWELNQDCPEEGLKAYALLEWLDGNGDISILTNDDRIEIQRIKNEIERLNFEYDSSEDVETDLLDQISNLEDELEQFDEKIDVYSIVPVGSYLEMQEFVVLSEALEGRKYAVGTEEDAQNSAEEYVEQLINDIGYTGFARSFYENYLDEDQVLDYARSFYEDDVNQNPEVYLDENERELSTRQVEEIDVLKNKIEQLEKIKNDLEERSQESEEDFSDDIDRLDEQIEDLKTEIDDIEISPEGDFPYELIDEKVDSLVDDVKDNLRYFMNEYGLNIEDYIDHNAFVEGVIEVDGLGIINRWDGTIDEVQVLDDTFYVMRID